MNQPACDSRDYVRFIILFAARSGSTMLASSLNSNPHVTCLGEVFNSGNRLRRSRRPGQGALGAQDRALPGQDFRIYLRERVFSDHPSHVDAVGFKIAYAHFVGFPGLREALADDTAIRVLHLARRNSLRQLVSLKIAQNTGIWYRDAKTRTVGDKLAWAIRHPVAAAGRLRQRLRQEGPASAGPRPGVTVSPEELVNFVVRMNQSVSRFDDLFREHPQLMVFYEDMIERRDEVFDQAQAFLGIDPRPLDVVLRKQNPQPLRELIANYDELYEAFRTTPQATLFD